MKINKWILPIIPLLIAFFFFGTTAIGDSRDEAASMTTMVASSHSVKDFNKKPITANVQNSIKFLKEKEAQKLKEEEERLRLEQERLKKEKIEQEKLQKIEDEKKKEEEQKRFEEEKRAANLKVEEERKNQESDNQTKTEIVQEKQPTTDLTISKWNYPGLSSYEKDVVKYTNMERIKNGLPELKIDSQLSEIAWYKSKDMHENDYFDHHSPTYGSPFEMMKSFGIPYRAAAENIAIGYDNAQEVVTAWMNSEGHRRNILNPNYTHIGVGNDPKGYLSTQMFIKK